MGITVVSYTIKDIRDEEVRLNSLLNLVYIFYFILIFILILYKCIYLQQITIIFFELSLKFKLFVNNKNNYFKLIKLSNSGLP